MPHGQAAVGMELRLWTWEPGADGSPERLAEPPGQGGPPWLAGSRVQALAGTAPLPAPQVPAQPSAPSPGAGGHLASVSVKLPSNAFVIKPWRLGSNSRYRILHKDATGSHEPSSVAGQTRPLRNLLESPSSSVPAATWRLLCGLGSWPVLKPGGSGADGVGVRALGADEGRSQGTRKHPLLRLKPLLRGQVSGHFPAFLGAGRRGAGSSPKLPGLFSVGAVHRGLLDAGWAGRVSWGSPVSSQGPAVPLKAQAAESLSMGRAGGGFCQMWSEEGRGVKLGRCLRGPKL